MSEEKRTGRRVFAGLQRAAPLANSLLLLIFVIWVLCFDRSRTELLDPDLLRASNQPEAADSGGPRSSTILVGGLVAVSFLVMLLGLWWGRPKSRSISAWFVFSFLICGWLAVWVGRNDLYWFGHAWRVSGEGVRGLARRDDLFNPVSQATGRSRSVIACRDAWKYLIRPGGCCLVQQLVVAETNP